MADKTLITLGIAARRLGVAVHLLRYALERRPVPPTDRVGITRVWTEADFPEIERSLALIQRRRTRP